jgi:hypothetical protein
MAIPKHAVPTVITLIPKEQHTPDTLIAMYTERIGPMTEHIENRLNEYFIFIQNARKAENDWFFWCHKAIMDVATKTTTEQRTIAYLIGVFKAWLNYGFGTFYNAEVFKAKELFENTHGVSPSQACTAKLNNLIHNYGIVYAVSAILNCESKEEEDASLRIANACEAYAEKNYNKLGGQ